MASAGLMSHGTSTNSSRPFWSLRDMTAYTPVGLIVYGRPRSFHSRAADLPGRATATRPEENAFRRSS